MDTTIWDSCIKGAKKGLEYNVPLGLEAMANGAFMGCVNNAFHTILKSKRRKVRIGYGVKIK